MKKFTTLIAIAFMGITLRGQIQVPENSDSPIYYLDGKVGIGTSSPLVKLHVQNNKVGVKSGSAVGIFEAKDAYLDITSSPADKWGSGINFIEGNGSSNADMWSVIRQTTGGSGNSSIGFYYGTNNDPSTNILRFLIQKDGKVGIGTGVPQAKLHVSSGTSGDAVILVESDTDNNNESDNPFLQLKQDGGQVTGVIGLNGDAESEYDGALANALYLENTNASCGIQFATNNTAQLTVLPSGEIGIGTTTPQAKLDVAGTIRATEIKVEAQTADFVFGDDYPLLDLNQVETFIKKHKHLPDIPGAKEMEESGINLAEMNKLLLQKIEELTLYAIEQEGKLKEKDRTVKNLKSEMENLKETNRNTVERLTNIEALLRRRNNNQNNMQ